MPFRRVPEGIEVAVRAQPGARASRIEGVEHLADGSPVLKVRVSAPPEGGKANAALVKLLAKSWKLAKSDVEIVSGQTGRRKRVLIAGADETFFRMLEQRYAAPAPKP